jgi:hypothetical protein
MAVLSLFRRKKLLHRSGEILGEEALKKYTPENYPKTIATAAIEFKERMLSIIQALNINTYDGKASSSATKKRYIKS